MFTVIIQKIKLWFEQQAFGVCTKLGEKLGIRSTRIRMYFIYLSFFTAGSPILLYFIMAFYLEHRDIFPFGNAKKAKLTFWDM